ncbi:hypothetical protein SAMN05421743_12027 [Thalassobacillus cyri]|uniref:SdpI/YhfL protein family protein n=1 Tax=Thalassobacillus cyri TaxID=571932 RepID=A0A1H4GYI9_9BACI|nr:hypothetical protein [Thalassobacillus cyri]SEB14617.1 hypothetical protein SAMN05421743_12027 [Thalassobacillus cyri]
MVVFITVIGVTLLIGILGYFANSNTEDEPILVHRWETNESQIDSASTATIYFEPNNRVAALLKLVGYVFLVTGFLVGLFFLINEEFLGFFWMVICAVISFILALGFAEVVQQLHHINIRLRKKEFLLDEEETKANE